MPHTQALCINICVQDIDVFAPRMRKKNVAQQKSKSFYTADVIETPWKKKAVNTNTTKQISNTKSSDTGLRKNKGFKPAHKIRLNALKLKELTHFIFSFFFQHPSWLLQVSLKILNNPSYYSIKTGNLQNMRNSIY
jgi:hypothetical protein